MPIGTTVHVVKTGLVALLAAHDDLDGVQVEDGYPNPQHLEVEGVVVGDVEGTQTPATMRPPAGTRDEIYEVEVVTWCRIRDDDREAVRGRAIELGQAVERVVYDAAGDPFGTFPGVQVRRLTITSWRLQEMPVELGREAQVIQRVEVRARLAP